MSSLFTAKANLATQPSPKAKGYRRWYSPDLSDAVTRLFQKALCCSERVQSRVRKIENPSRPVVDQPSSSAKRVTMNPILPVAHDDLNRAIAFRRLPQGI